MGLKIKGIFTDLTPAEKLYLLTHFWQVSTIKGDAEKALAEAQKRFSTGLHNGPGDAFRHCYWSAMLARDIGADNAKTFTDAHEDWSDNPPDEKAMDLANNKVGIEIGKNNPSDSDQMLADRCQQALTDGKLTTAPVAGAKYSY
jgi:hypothetical protein